MNSLIVVFEDSEMAWKEWKENLKVFMKQYFESRKVHKALTFIQLPKSLI